VTSRVMRAVTVIPLVALSLWAGASAVEAAQGDDVIATGIDLVATALFGSLVLHLVRRRRARLVHDQAGDTGIPLGVRRPTPRFAGPAGPPIPMEQFSLAEEEVAHHVLLLGATGSGKTTSLLRIAEGAIGRGLAFVAVDLKGSPEVSARLAALAAARGRRTFQWSFDGPDRWNPLGRGDVSELKDKLIGMETWTEPHYKRAAERYVQTVFTVLATCGENASVARVAELMRPAALNAMLRSAPADVAGRVSAYLEDLEHSRDQRSAIQGLGTRLALLAESSAGRYLEAGPDGHSVDLLSCIRRGDVVVFSLDSLRYGELAPQVGGLVIQDIKTVASAMLRAGAPLRVLVGLDEISALDGDQLLGLLSRAREAGLAILLSTQELADLARVDPLFADQVLANTNVKIVHRQDVPESAERLSGVLGTYEDWEHTYVERDALLSLLARSVSPVVGTRRLVDRYVIHPNVFKALVCGHAVVIRKHPRACVDVVAITPPGAEQAGA
jgi:conjugal transfer pilus assembly protein TraD